MKTATPPNPLPVPGLSINPELDKYDNVVLFPDKLAKANEQVKKSGFPKLPEKNVKTD